MIAIVSENGTCVATYTYDTWGNVISQSGTLAAVNPIRYRGYYYDSETGLYYLGSRYYDPAVKRFINADTYTNTDTGFIGQNMFAYCNNSPAQYSDADGTFICTATGAIIGGVLGALNAAYNGDSVWKGALVGAATGALAGIGADAAIATGGVGAVAFAAVTGAASNAGNTYLTDKLNGRSSKASDLIIDATVGAAANALTFGVGGGSLKKVGGKVVKNIISNGRDALLKNTTKKVGAQIVRKTAKTVAKHIFKNGGFELAMTYIISRGAYLQSCAFKKMVQ